MIACLAIAIAMVGCAQKQAKTKITDIPVTTQSNDARTSVQQGLEMQDQGDQQQARMLFTKAIEQDPKLAIAYVLRAGISNTTQEFAEDMKKAKENLSGVSNWEKWYYDYLETFLTSDWNKRLEITKTIADSFPDAARAQVDLGATYAGGNDIQNSRACYQKAVELDSNWVGGYAALTGSYLFFEPRDFKTAEGYALRTVSLAPKSPGAEIALGDCYRAENDLAKARDAYSKAVELDPNASEGYFKKGHANTFLGNYDEARQNYSDAGTHDVSKTTSNEYIALTYLYQGDFKTGNDKLMEFEMKADSSGESPAVIKNAKLTYLGDCERIAMQTGDAAALKSLIPMTEPMVTETGNDIGTEQAKLTQQATNLYWQSVLAAMEENYGDAKTRAEQIKSTLESVNDPNKLDPYHFVMGYISMKQKDYGDAVSHFEQDHPENNVYYQYWLAMANESAGNADKANALYKQVAIYNFNGIDYALIRNEVLKKTPAM